MWLPRHIKLLFCLNASIHRKQICMALNSYQKKSIRWRTLFCTGKLPTGLEPVIYWLRINRSTNWATEAFWTVLYYDTRGGVFCQEKNESSRIRLLFTHHVTKALRCNGFVKVLFIIEILVRIKGSSFCWSEMVHGRFKIALVSQLI